MIAATGPHPLERRAMQAASALFAPKSSILLAVSGGSDSTGLLYLLSGIAGALELKLTAAFVNHNLRKGVDREYDLVKSQAGALGVPVEYLEIPRAEAARAAASGSIQAWAREARYRLLVETARGERCDCLATGHTRDDQAETVLLRIARGAGLDGVAGIAARRELKDGVALVRPLLRFTRQEIRDYLGARGAGWSEDPSNADRRFLRVRVRSELLPLLESMQPNVASRLAGLAEDAAAITGFLDRECILGKLPFENLNLDNGIKVDSRFFSDLPRPLWSRAVRILLRRVRGDLERIERVHIEQILSAIETGKNSAVLSLPGPVRLYVSGGAIYAFPGDPPAAIDLSIAPEAIGPGRWKVCSDELGVSAEISSEDPGAAAGLVLRTRQRGDRLWGSGRKFKAVLIDARIPRFYRDRMPVIADGGQIVSCPGLVASRKAGVKIDWCLGERSPVQDVIKGLPATV